MKSFWNSTYNTSSSIYTATRIAHKPTTTVRISSPKYNKYTARRKISFEQKSHGNLQFFTRDIQLIKVIILSRNIPSSIVYNNQQIKLSSTMLQMKIDSRFICFAMHLPNHLPFPPSLPLSYYRHKTSHTYSSNNFFTLSKTILTLSSPFPFYISFILFIILPFTFFFFSFYISKTLIFYIFIIISIISLFLILIPLFLILLINSNNSKNYIYIS